MVETDNYPSLHRPRQMHVETHDYASLQLTRTPPFPSKALVVSAFAGTTRALGGKMGLGVDVGVSMEVRVLFQDIESIRTSDYYLSFVNQRTTEFHFIGSIFPFHLAGVRV